MIRICECGHTENLHSHVCIICPCQKFQYSRYKSIEATVYGMAPDELNELDAIIQKKKAEKICGDSGLKH